ncbi:MAG: SusD/RagB family nutrient-binding outer membrane lipoprotein [Prevotellaceae bacterium]|nr:SusD/RagB family nutrient-binding outer membrane lipoprotein [Prevotellaceae bacterium]
MKRIILITILFACVFTFSRCSEADFDEKYRDPGKSSTVELPKLFAGTLLLSKEWAMSTYGRFFGWEAQVLVKQANTIGITLDNNTFYRLEGYTDGMPPYGDLAKMISSWHFMQSVFEALPEAEKPASEAYMLAAETQLYAMTAYIMSSFGDIPFDEVGQVAVTGDISKAHPKYQDDQEIYGRILDRLGELNTRFAAVAEPDPLFKGQDFINRGDLDKWRRYVNSVRLRVALLVSANGALASKGQGVIAEILGNASNNPVIETNDQNVCIAQVNKSGSALDVNGGSGFDWINLRIASTEMIKRMQKAGDGGVWVDGQDDPRLPILFCLATVNGEFAVLTPEEEVVADPPKNGKAVPKVFRGACAAMDYNVWETYLYPSANRAYFSYIRENGFFKNNRNWDNPIITAAEVSFIKAEAFQRGWAQGDAKAAFKTAIKQSVDFYFKYQDNRTAHESQITGTSSTSYSFRVVINNAKPTDAWIDKFADDRWSSRIDGSSYTEQLEAILEQKWLNFGYMYAGEQWNDLRRTGYPRMSYQKDRDPNAEIPYPCNRLRYPENERNNNTNFSTQVGSQDNYKDVLFWAKPDWHDGPTWQ